MVDKINTHEAHLICAHPLSCSNKQLRAEFSHFLCTAAIPLVTRVRNFDFQHVTHFLLTLEEAQKDAFRVGHDGSSARKLILQLHGPYTKPCIDNLQTWIEQVRAFVGPGRLDELNTSHETIPRPQFDINIRRDCVPLWRRIREVQESMECGAGEVEAAKIMEAFRSRAYADDSMHAPEHTAIVGAKAWVFR